jgi:hypothetical protein
VLLPLVRERLAQVQGEPVEGGTDDETLRELLDLLRPDRAMERLTSLPPGYRERYEQRVKEITARVERELDEFMRVLEAEYKETKGKRRG